MQIKAIDISFCQKGIDFAAVKASGVKAIIIRNGYLGKTDTAWEFNMRGALTSGFDVGTYTYIMSENPQQAEKEASETIKRLEKYKGRLNYPVFADMEDNKYLTSRFNKQSRTEILLAFLNIVAKAGYYPAVYTNPAWLTTYIDKTKILGQYDIWLAHYTNSPNKPTKYDYGQTIWQWGLDNIKGVGDVDGDLVYVDYPAKIKAAKKNFLQREKLKSVELAFDAAIRSAPSAKANRIGLLKAGMKCVIVEDTETTDPTTKYVYIKLGGEESQWIVKSAIKQ